MSRGATGARGATPLLCVGKNKERKKKKKN